MKEDNYVVIIFIVLIGILATALIPNYAPAVPITGAVVMASKGMDISTVVLAVIIIIAALIAVLVAFYLKKGDEFPSLISKSRTEMPKTGYELGAFSREQFKKPEIVRAPRSENEALDHYVKAALASGKSKSQIRRDLLGVGWPTETIETVMKQI